jgi:ABC-2 type transport system permease protein
VTDVRDRDAARTSAPRPDSVTGTPNVIGLVMRREIRTRARSKSFIFSTLFTLVLLVGAIVLPTVLGGGPTTHEIGVLGTGNDQIVAAAERLANVGVTEDERTTIAVTEFTERDAAEEAVAEGEVAAVLIDGDELVIDRSGGFGSSSLTDLLQQAAGTQQVVDVVGEESAARISAALSGDALTTTPMSGQDAAQTEGRTWLAYGGVFLTYILILQYGTWMLSSVTEEKTNRVIEILLSTARPWQLFAGKVAGTAALGLGQFTLTLAAALTAIRVTGAFELPEIPVGFTVVLVVWVFVGFGTYLVLFGAAGALASKMEDAQSAVTPITLVIVLGFVASIVALGDPGGKVATIGTFIPLSAPFLVPMRAALNALPWWQHGLALVLSLAAVVGLTMLSGRVYRGGALQFAGKLSWRQALRRSVET